VYCTHAARSVRLHGHDKAACRHRSWSWLHHGHHAVLLLEDSCAHLLLLHLLHLLKLLKLLRLQMLLKLLRLLGLRALQQLHLRLLRLLLGRRRGLLLSRR
jgi:hypothetical protein